MQPEAQDNLPRPVFLHDPPVDAAVEAAFAEDREADGYVNNLTRLWCWRPDLYSGFAGVREELSAKSTLTERDWAVLVTATAAQRGDSYCALAWGKRLARLTDESTAAQVISAEPAPGLSDREAALARWAREVVRDPNSTTVQHVEHLRRLGLDDREIFEATAFVAFRLAFSTINDALGAAPDAALAENVPQPVREAVTFGRGPAPSVP